MGRVVLVTGAARYLGARACALLANDPQVDRVVAVDVVTPPYDLGGAAFVRTDIRDAGVGELIEREAIDTVVHAGVLATPDAEGGRTSMKETNVIGTMQLLAACQRSSSVRRFVVKSSTSVYGASPRDPAVFGEEMTARAAPRSGYAKDSVEVEAYVRGFARRRTDIAVTILRFANVIGPGVTTPLTTYFELPVVPTPLGFDGRLQFVHEDDALEVLRRAAVEEQSGVFNVAGNGMLLLSQTVRLAGRVAVPVPFLASDLATQVFRRFGLLDFTSEQARFLAYGRVVDCSRLHDVLGYRPKHSTAAAFAEFVQSRCQPGPLDPALVQAMADAFQRGLHADEVER